MRHKMRALVVVTTLGLVGMAVAARGSAADDDFDELDTPGPEFSVGANVHGDGFEVKQRVTSESQGRVTIVTRLNISTAVPPGPPNLNGAIPPGPPQVEKLTVKVTVPSHGQAHAAGLLLAVGLAEGLPLQTIVNVFAQLNWSVQFKIKGQVAPIGAAHAVALSNLIAAGFLVSDRPGGGCDGALGFFRTGADLLGLPASCGALVPQTN